MNSTHKPAQRIAVIGAGWAGLAAAVSATQAGHRVSVYEMSAAPGGRARQIPSDSRAGVEPGLDNGQHLLTGAYKETLRLMRLVGVPISQVFERARLQWVDIHGHGLRLPPGPLAWSLVRGVVSHHRWTWQDRAAFLAHAALWRLKGFRCHPSWTVSELTRRLPRAVRSELTDPLCVAALNTAPSQASAQVFLRVLRDSFAGDSDAADLLFIKQPLSALWPHPACQWLQAQGAPLHWHHRVRSLQPQGCGWQVDQVHFDQVIVATTSVEAGRLCQPFARGWAEQALALTHEPIATVYVQAPGIRLPYPMAQLDWDARHPAQCVFDHGHWGAPVGQMAMVVSAAGPWLERGQSELTAAALSQLRKALGNQLKHPLIPLRTLIDKRATFHCTPGLQRPPRVILPGLQAAGDYVDGPYPATLEGAVRSGVQAAYHCNTSASGLQRT